MTDEIPPLPQAWVGMYECSKRDAMYYEKCLRDMRDTWVEARGMLGAAPDSQEKTDWLEFTNKYIPLFDDVLAHKHQPDGVDLDKPNYGMF